MLATDKVRWKQADSGVWERDFDGAEDFFYLCNTQLGGHFQFTIIVKYKTTVICDEEFATRMKQVWIALRHDHPFIAALQTERTFKYTSATIQGELDNWLVETFHVLHDKTIKDVDEIVVARPHLYFFPQSSEIAIRVPHDRLDASGAAMLCQNLFSLLSNPKQVVFGNEHQNLSPSLSIALGISPITEAQKAYVQQIVDQCAASANNTVGVPVRNIDSPPTQTNHYRTTFTPQETDKIVKYAKERGFTVTQLVHAAIAHSMVKVAPEQNTGKGYTSMIPVDIRRDCIPPYNSHAHAVACSVISWPISIDLIDSDIQVTISKFKKFYTTIKGAEWPTPGFAMLDCDFAPIVMNPIITMALSSWGVLDDKVKKSYGEFEIEDFSSSGKIVLPTPWWNVWTWHGILNFALHYNATYFEDSIMYQCLHSTKSILLELLENK